MIVSLVRPENCQGMSAGLRGVYRYSRQIPRSPPRSPGCGLSVSAKKPVISRRASVSLDINAAAIANSKATMIDKCSSASISSSINAANSR